MNNDRSLSYCTHFLIMIVISIADICLFLILCIAVVLWSWYCVYFSLLNTIPHTRPNVGRVKEGSDARTLSLSFFVSSLSFALFFVSLIPFAHFSGLSSFRRIGDKVPDTFFDPFPVTAVIGKNRTCHGLVLIMNAGFPALLIDVRE